MFALFNADCADKDGLSFFVALLYLLDNVIEFTAFGLENNVGMVNSLNGLVCRDFNNVELVNL